MTDKGGGGALRISAQREPIAQYPTGPDNSPRLVPRRNSSTSVRNDRNHLLVQSVRFACAHKISNLRRLSEFTATYR